MKREWDGGNWGKRLKVCGAGKCVCVFSLRFVSLEAYKLVQGEMSVEVVEGMVVG
jgi:hypothetical protein